MGSFIQMQIQRKVEVLRVFNLDALRIYEMTFLVFTFDRTRFIASKMIRQKMKWLSLIYSARTI